MSRPLIYCGSKVCLDWVGSGPISNLKSVCHLHQTVPKYFLRDKYPSRLHSLLRSSYFEEPRKGGLGKFFDRSRTRVGRQSIQNRLDHFRQINRPWSGENLSNDLIRILLKNTFFNYRRNQWKVDDYLDYFS